MYKLLIADDEKLIREGLVDYIDWGKYHIKVIGTACDGNEVLNMIQTVWPDIILMDINMPYLNGIQLLEQIRTKEYDIEVILISAYSDFQYAQKAIKFGAADYILKPLSEEELENSVGKCIKRLQESKMSSEEDINQTYFVPALRKMVVQEHENNQKLCQKLLQYYGINLMDLNIFYLSCIGEADELEIHENTRIIDFCLEFPPNLKTFVLITELSFEEITEQITTEERKYDLYQCLNDDYAKEFTTHIFCLLKKERIVDLLQQDKITNQFAEALEEETKELTVQSFQKFLFTSIFCFYRKKIIVDIHTFRKSCIYFIDSFYEQIELHYGGIFPPTDRLRIINEMYQYDNAYHMYTYMEYTLSAMVEKIEENYCTNQIITLTLQYIHKNYPQNISLNTASEYLNVSRSYLSRLFKKETGSNFSDYLINYRMKEAKKLLLEGTFKVYEISEQVGYSDVVPFTKMFRKTTGVTPKKWIASNLKKKIL